MFYSIKEFADIIGVSTYTLRNWEKNGKLLPHHRTQGGQRVYTEEQASAYLGVSPTRDVVFSFVGGKLYNDSSKSLSDNEIDQIIDILNKTKQGRV